MPVGLEIINDAGTILIDSKDPSLSLHSKVTLSATNRRITHTFNNVEFPTLALRSTAGWVCVISETRSGNSITYVLGTFGNTQSVTLYLFDRPTLSPANFGFQVFDEQGRLTFDAARQPGRVVALKDGNGVWYGTSGVDYAAIVTRSIFGWYSANPDYNDNGVQSMWVQRWDEFDVRTAIQMVGANIEVYGREHTIRYQVQPELATHGVPVDYTMGLHQIVVLDVTGF